jgi:hypothetical protein
MQLRKGVIKQNLKHCKQLRKLYSQTEKQKKKNFQAINQGPLLRNCSVSKILVSCDIVSLVISLPIDMPPQSNIDHVDSCDSGVV